MINELITPSIPHSFIKLNNACQDTYEDRICDWHIHNEYEMFLLTKGTKVFYSLQNTCLLEEGDIIFVNKNVPHKTVTPAGSSGILMQFKHETTSGSAPSFEYLLELTQQRRESMVVFKRGTSLNISLNQCIVRIYDENEKKNKAFILFIKAYMQEIFSHLYRNGILTHPSDLYETNGLLKLTPVFDYVENHYSETVTLDNVSTLLHVDKAHFCRIFKKVLNITFSKYLNYVRINHAKELLKTTNRSITEIAYAVGFVSTSYFIKQFSLYTSYTPLKYRSMCRYE